MTDTTKSYVPLGIYGTGSAYIQGYVTAHKSITIAAHIVQIDRRKKIIHNDKG